MLEIDNGNLLTVESVVARQLGEGVRWHYQDEPRRRWTGCMWARRRAE